MRFYYTLQENESALSLCIGMGWKKFLQRDCFILWQFCNRLLLALTDLQSSWSEVQDVLHTKLIYWFNLPKKIPIEWSSSPWLYMYYETLQMCASFSDDVKTILKVLDWFFFKCLIFLISIYTILVLCTLWIMNDMQTKVQYLLHICREDVRGVAGVALATPFFLHMCIYIRQYI